MGKVREEAVSAVGRRRLVPPWWMFWAVAGAVLLAGVLLIRLPSVPGDSGLAKEGRVRSAGMVLTVPPQTEEEEDMVREELALLDPTPLFLPTRWTSGGAVVTRAGDQEPGTAFRDFGPWFVFPENDPVLSVPSGAEVPTGALAALAEIEDPARRTNIALGRRDVMVPRLLQRAGRVEVIATGDGRTRLELELVLPVELGGENWRPVDLIALVDANGMVGRPMALGSTGDERLDAILPGLLARDRRIEARLAAGSYRLVVGP